MAKRISAALEGLGKGLTNASHLMMNNYMQTQARDRYDPRPDTGAGAVGPDGRPLSPEEQILQYLQSLSQG